MLSPAHLACCQRSWRLQAIVSQHCKACSQPLYHPPSDLGLGRRTSWKVNQSCMEPIQHSIPRRRGFTPQVDHVANLPEPGVRTVQSSSSS